MSGSSTPDLTTLLRKAGRGDKNALDEAMQAVYEDLWSRAAASMRRERSNHTLQPTAVVHEAYLRLVMQDHASWEDRGQFFAMAATCIRRILVDHARGKRALKRGVGQPAISLEPELALTSSSPSEFLALHEALERLAENDARKSQVVELRFFAGCENKEIARLLDVSLGTVERDLRLARAWLHRELSRGEPA